MLQRKDVKNISELKSDFAPHWPEPDFSLSGRKQMIGMRNRVIHGYVKIDDEIIWGTIIRHLPKLKTEIDNYLD